MPPRRSSIPQDAVISDELLDEFIKYLEKESATSYSTRKTYECKVVAHLRHVHSECPGLRALETKQDILELPNVEPSKSNEIPW